ncbi:MULTISPECIES: PAS domain-containing sensor histidine kinase [Chryseobacterium]|uniref:histidine kinase n=1 Tax=Chryseobacterium camelliae TaxID=1265445 RepID=A0ABU0TFT5_9FLAO|nr:MULTISPECIES: PAS domain-containing sensor histidine kinase [Chryseobacterium]MDT3406280.1 two-component system phosphate regulon sensor histidine kinase PhoR [Pseudacidovorax intermedius]MDQ1095922.1 two-component system phosphate regulon sensor histidine kinase PhoR [Chryseobacterium camelliae]MDQ1099858.1 two-component system phosphate regulon sensor histidine kinase PhoR [Chryseobacterium sp. SORGH_AS_1048]MDR6087204.1 two-component system phosphate regulon sensor histidine kinase PhoR [
MNTSQTNFHELSGSQGDHHLDLYIKALDSANSGIIITDNNQPDNPIVYCNRAFETITGYSRNEIIGHNCRFLQAQDRSQPERKLLSDCIEKGLDCKVEIRNYKKNGDLFWNELYLSPVKNPQGEITHFIGVQNDITARKKAEHDLIEEKASVEHKIQERTKELRENQIFLSSIIQTVRESLLVLDPDFRVLSANGHFLKTFKVSSEETVGKILYELGNHQWDIDLLKELLVKILPTNNPVIDFEVEHNFPHIGKKLMLLNAYRIEHDGQYKDRILLAIEDITDRREIERRKDDFLSIASHELKTPLTTIKGLVQLLQRMQEGGITEKYKATLMKVAVYVDRLNNLISELLDTSRIQSGNIELHIEPFDIDHLVKDTVDNIALTVPGYEINVSGKSGAIIRGDESQISQVVNNLVSNAIKYSPGSKKIEIHIAKVSNFVKISIRDFGMGISAQDKPRIFERFYRAGDIQKKFPGMGIGLYISHEIIANHNGTLWVESEVGEGSTFSFTLPISKK